MDITLPQPLQSLAAPYSREGFDASPYPAEQEQDTPSPVWMIRLFKTQPCNVEGRHDHRSCPWYHGERERRRPVFTDAQSLAYASVPCELQFDNEGSCPYGDQCGQCHSNTELLYHPDLYKKRFCHQHRNCPREKFCAFAHCREELLAPNFSPEEENNPTEDFMALRFKTKWCPLGGPHNWENCVYAHTYRDFRRVPVLGNAADTDYLTRCHLGFACPLAHGAKEQLYHPRFYKANPCSDRRCQRAVLCAFTHGEPPRTRAERRKSQKPSKPMPIPDAEQLLAQFQPNFGRPPVYQAQEEQKPQKPQVRRKEIRKSASEIPIALHEAEGFPGLSGNLEPSFLSMTHPSWNHPQTPILPVSPCSGGSFTTLASVNRASFESMPSFSPSYDRLKIPKPNLETDSNGWRTNSSFGPGTPIASLPSTPRSVVPSSSTRSGSTPVAETSEGFGSPVAALPIPVALLQA